MKEYPIIFSGDHPRKIQDLLKTQTRRVIKKLPILLPSEPTPELIELFKRMAVEQCPYQVGDRLWVRETWAVNPTMEDILPRNISSVAFVYYKALAKGSPLLRGKWRSSRLMPRWASRITLENGKRMEVVRAPAQTADDYNPGWAKVGPKWNNYQVIRPEDLIWHWDWDFKLVEQGT